jgi:hypothetical protein
VQNIILTISLAFTFSLFNGCSYENKTDLSSKVENERIAIEEDLIEVQKMEFHLYIDVENVYPEGIEYEVSGVDFKNGMRLEEGTYRYKVWKRGFKPKSGEVYLKEDTSINLKLEPL